MSNPLCPKTERERDEAQARIAELEQERADGEDHAKMREARLAELERERDEARESIQEWKADLESLQADNVALSTQVTELERERDEALVLRHEHYKQRAKAEARLARLEEALGEIATRRWKVERGERSIHPHVKQLQGLAAAALAETPEGEPSNKE